MTGNWVKIIARVMLMILSICWIPARADVIASQQVLSAAPTQQQQHERQVVAGFLARADVRHQLQQWGVNADDAQARVNALNDDEVHQLYGHVQSAPAAGMDIIGALIFIFIVLLITDILGLTKVFPFTRSIRH
ncbi:MAG: PA2779 family protein [Pseudomonadales bacterium]|nr:PA2779 family protein [Pseudomonadales bacterium]